VRGVWCWWRCAPHAVCVTCAGWLCAQAFHSAKARLSACIIAAENAPVPDAAGLIPGFVHLAPELARHFQDAAAAEISPGLGFPPGWGDWEMNPPSEPAAKKHS
jgi:hypothetical protein